MNKIRIYCFEEFLIIDSSDMERSDLLTFNNRYNGLHVNNNVEITEDALNVLKNIKTLNETNPIVTCRNERSKLKMRWHAHRLFICPIDKLTTTKKSNFSLLDNYVTDMEVPNDIIKLINYEKSL